MKTAKQLLLTTFMIALNLLIQSNKTSAQHLNAEEIDSGHWKIFPGALLKNRDILP